MAAGGDVVVKIFKIYTGEITALLGAPRRTFSEINNPARKAGYNRQLNIVCSRVKYKSGNYSQGIVEAIILERYKEIVARGRTLEIYQPAYREMPGP